MSLRELQYNHEVMKFPAGEALGCSYRWPGGQYCAIHTDRGILACGVFDCRSASEFSYALAIARGTPQSPLCVPQDLLTADVAEVSRVAADLGIRVGMSGQEALELLLKASSESPQPALR
ncbi:MAG: DUF1805 domain-containing protein [Pirellulaceae bacterium]|nr:DUF1805 domain-containing protein [Pirellulaceae bacterium]